MELSDQINQAEQVVNFLRRFENAVVILREAQNIEAQKGDRERAIKALGEETQTVKAEIARLDKEYGSAKKDLSDRKAQVVDLEKQHSYLQVRVAELKAALEAEEQAQSATIAAGVEEFRAKLAEETAKYVAECELQCGEAQAKLDAVNAALGAIRERI